MWIEIRRIDNRTEPKFVLEWFADFFILSSVWVDPTGTSSSRPAKALGPTRPVGPSHARGAQHTKLIHGAQWWINCVGLDRTGFVVFNWQTSIYCSIRSLFFYFAFRSGQDSCRKSRTGLSTVDRLAPPPRGPISISRNVGTVRGGGQRVDRARAQQHVQMINQQEDRLDNDVQRFFLN